MVLGAEKKYWWLAHCSMWHDLLSLSAFLMCINVTACGDWRLDFPLYSPKQGIHTKEPSCSPPPQFLFCSLDSPSPPFPFSPSPSSQTCLTNSSHQHSGDFCLEVSVQETGVHSSTPTMPDNQLCQQHNRISFMFWSPKIQVLKVCCPGSKRGCPGARPSLGAHDAFYGLEQADLKPLKVPPCGLLSSPLDGTILLQGGHLVSLLQCQLVFAVQNSGNSFIMSVPGGNLIINVVLRHFYQKLHFTQRVVAQQ